MPRKPWRNPKRPEGQTCPLCKAPPGSLCRRANGSDVVGGWHERRIQAAEAAAVLAMKKAAAHG